MFPPNFFAMLVFFFMANIKANIKTKLFSGLATVRNKFVENFSRLDKTKIFDSLFSLKNTIKNKVVSLFVNKNINKIFSHFKTKLGQLAPQNVYLSKNQIDQKIKNHLLEHGLNSVTKQVLSNNGFVPPFFVQLATSLFIIQLIYHVAQSRFKNENKMPKRELPPYNPNTYNTKRKTDEIGALVAKYKPQYKIYYWILYIILLLFFLFGISVILKLLNVTENDLFEIFGGILTNIFEYIFEMFEYLKYKFFDLVESLLGIEDFEIAVEEALQRAEELLNFSLEKVHEIIKSIMNQIAQLDAQFTSLFTQFKSLRTKLDTLYTQLILLAQRVDKLEKNNSKLANSKLIREIVVQEVEKVLKFVNKERELINNQINN